MTRRINRNHMDLGSRKSYLAEGYPVKECFVVGVLTRRGTSFIEKTSSEKFSRWRVGEVEHVKYPRHKRKPRVNTDSYENCAEEDLLQILNDSYLDLLA